MLSIFLRRRIRLGAIVCGAVALLSVAALGATASARRSHHHHPRPHQHHARRIKHVLLLSVDGLHQSDLRWYLQHHPKSALAALARSGVQFTAARTPFPSDSFPGMVGQATGGNPSSTGVFYDDSYNRRLLPAGTTHCPGTAPGAEVTYFEALDKNPSALDAGQGIPGLPDSILDMTGNPRDVIDPAQLPVDPATCKVVYPHSYLKVNTIFEVARAAGLRTAWSDKHPAYEILNGPSGRGVQDLFTPEINSDAPTPGSSGDWTSDNSLTQRYDSYKVRAVLNEIDGRDHSGRTHVGTPAIFGMNFQSVSTAEKLAMSGGQPGGYLPDGTTPGPVLSRALDFVDARAHALLHELRARHLLRTTAVILSAKHGQSPDKPSALTRIDDGEIIDALNAAWQSAHPSDPKPLVAFSINDDAMLMWLNDRSEQAAKFARDFLLAHSGTGNDIHGNPKPYQHSGLRDVTAGSAAAQYFHLSHDDARVPDLIGFAQYGTVYTGKKKKIAEHGGDNPQDRDVPLVVSAPGIRRGAIRRGAVETTQIAPTILRLLRLNPESLRAVRIEHGRALPLG